MTPLLCDARFCVLCGTRLDGLKRRLFCPVEGRRFIRERCRPTPFLHAFLSSSDAPDGTAQYMCIPCVNWKRRVVQARPRGGAKRPLLQLDQMILFLMQPGRQQEPDLRCMERLVRAVRQAHNPYRASVFPAPVRWIAARIAGDTFHDCVVAWWEYNGQTEFFASAQEGRRVRCALKASRSDAGGLGGVSY